MRECHAFPWTSQFVVGIVFPCMIARINRISLNQQLYSEQPGSQFLSPLSVISDETNVSGLAKYSELIPALKINEADVCVFPHVWCF